MQKQLDLIKKECENCQKCALGATRTKLVFSSGVPNNKLVLVGEAPGYWEDQKGEPFVGKAGQLLDKIFESVGLSRKEHVYICNTIKCRLFNFLFWKYLGKMHTDHIFQKNIPSLTV